MEHVGTSTARRAEGNAIVYMFMQPAATPKKLVWDIPTDLHSIDIPIDFDNLHVDVRRH